MTDQVAPLFADHVRTFRENKFVYPVLSRRSRGISVGVNLNPDKVCNFDCIYCQVDRRSDAETRFVESERLLNELDVMLTFVRSGAIYRDAKFQHVPESLRRLNDIAFSGDGEPTTHKNFSEIVARVAKLKRQHGLDQAKLVLITNASMFHRADVQRGLEILCGNNGEIWAKLEAGTEAYYRQVARTRIPFQRILDNIITASRMDPLVIQSLFMRIQNETPPESEVIAYCDRLNEIVRTGGQIQRVQIYSVARQPAERDVTALTPAEIDAIASMVTTQTGLATETYDGEKGIRKAAQAPDNL